MRDARALMERLPSLYRPEPGDGTLLATFLDAVAAELGSGRDDIGMVMPAHWAYHADRAAFDPWFTTRRARAGLPVLAPTDVIDFADAHAVLVSIKDAATPLHDALRTLLPATVAADLDAWDDLQPPPVPLQRRVLDMLNRRVRGLALYDATLFADIALPAELVAAAEALPTGPERIKVNAALLIAAFPVALRRATLDLPWVRDLGRIGALVPLVPWREPALMRESVEAYRIRLARMIALYRKGLGTVGALRAVVEATLPVDPGHAPVLRDRPFQIEEFAPLATEHLPGATNGPPTDVVGPLMRWTLTNDGLAPAIPTVFITGVEPGDGFAQTVDPMVELYAVGDARPRIGIGFAGSLAPDQTLRLRPGLTTWTLGADGLARAVHLLSDEAGTDPTSPGEPTIDAGAPADLVALTHTPDGMLWAAADGGARLVRFDGDAWIDVAVVADAIRALAAADDHLLIGTASGLLRLALYPLLPGEDEPQVVDGFAGIAVRTIGPRQPDGTRWIGTDDGALSWDGLAPPVTVALGGGAGIATPIDATHVDRSGAVHFAGPLGILEFQPERAAWYWYAGAEFSEQTPEWRSFDDSAADAPADDTVFIPPVQSVLRGPDGALWMGTSAGIARYVARSVNGGTYTTVLEAFPDLSTGAVPRMQADERGGVWFCTERGLLRYDGRDFWQRRGAEWAHLGRVDVLAGIGARARGAWRFERASGQWQRFDERMRAFAVPALGLRTTPEPAITAVVTTDSVVADTGVLEGAVFETAAAVATSDLFLHIQPTEEFIVPGGMPYIPRLPTGDSSWRYLAREPADLVPAAAEHRPAWSSEGRLFPPPPALDAPYAGRWDVNPPPDGNFDQAVYSYDPAARVAFAFDETRPCSVLVRLRRRPGDGPVDPAVIERVWEGIQLVRPAGVRMRLAVDETIVRGS